MVVINHGGETEAAHFRGLVRPFTVRLTPGSCRQRPRPSSSKKNASSSSRTPSGSTKDGTGSHGGIKNDYNPAGPFGSPDAMAVTSPDESSARGGSSEKEKKRHQSSSRTIGEESVSSPVDSPSAVPKPIPGLLAKSTSSASLRQASTGGVSSDGGLAAGGGSGSGTVSSIEEKMESQAGLLRSLSVGLHPSLLVEPLTTVGEVVKWYTLQVRFLFVVLFGLVCRFVSLGGVACSFSNCFIQLPVYVSD